MITMEGKKHQAMMDLLKNFEHCVMTKSQDCYIGVVMDGGCHLFPSNFTCAANLAALNGIQREADTELIAGPCSLPIPVCVRLKMIGKESLLLTGSETGRVAHWRVVFASHRTSASSAAPPPAMPRIKERINAPKLTLEQRYAKALKSVRTVPTSP